ncbi:FAD/NAD(P)-binding protein [Streptacidiphilus sp. PB12-B1b]|uniref:FAD/NAD(P)-binding protein n=1 Tax=Streptacidiphilus sp. PB12-B1b TaxID=2705012 RepID=UPI0015F79A7A|nr:FAD/NAD(P)-binding protein [Streptacidiphilus sp. PB12-B1b]QMU80123.1 FAD/NAD(P)-binding protein [Streptacidiphilus sp. PB12-B1b]
MNSPQFEICLVGAGPRGLSVLERLCANAAAGVGEGPVTVHVVDPFPPGPGQVWRTGQSPHLLMNTVAGQVTMFTDESVTLAGPLAPGPSLYEWARFLTLMGPIDGGSYSEQVLAEARTLGPDSYPTRAFYGRYLEWVFQRVTRTAPGRVRVLAHRSRAVALEEEADGTQRVLLEDGVRLSGLHAVVLAQGHLPARGSASEAERADFAKRHALTYIAPSNPADVDLAAVRPGETVALLGLGLNFFDYTALLTLGRGGRFEYRGERLVYRPSGLEPLMVAGSRRGLPFHSRGENQKGPHGRHLPALLTPEAVELLRRSARRQGGLDFRTQLWPLIAKEVEAVYYTALLTRQGRAAEAEELRARYLAAEAGGAEAQLLDAFGVDADQRWDWSRISRPYLGRKFGSPEDFHGWLLDHLRGDLDEARAGNVDGPLKAALDVLRDLRNEVRQVVDHGGLTGDSHRRDLDGWYTPLNAFLSIGPPAQRIAQAIALIEAGVLRVLGPEVRAELDDAAGVFTVESAAVPGSRTTATALVEARLPGIELRETADPLLLWLLAEGQCRPYEIGDAAGGGYETGGLAVTPSPYRLVDAAGRAHPRRFAFGVPTESVHWATAAGIRPGVNSVILQDSDAIARAVLSLAPQPSGGGGGESRVSSGSSESRPIEELTR